MHPESAKGGVPTAKYDRKAGKAAHPAANFDTSMHLNPASGLIRTFPNQSHSICQQVEPVDARQLSGSGL
jgi:hypothetical protein